MAKRKRASSRGIFSIQRFKNLTLVKQLLILVGLPVSALLGLGILASLNNYQDAQFAKAEAARIDEISKTVVALSQFIDSLQQERHWGMAYSDSKRDDHNRKFQSAISESDRKLEQALERIRISRKADDLDFIEDGESLDRVIVAINAVKAIRDKITAKDSSSTPTRLPYSALISGLNVECERISLKISDGLLVKNFTGFISLLYAMEAISQEGSIIYTVFARDAFDLTPRNRQLSEYEHYTMNRGHQSAHWRNWKRFAPSDIYTYYEEIQTNNAINKEIGGWKDIAHRDHLAGGFGVDPEVWIQKHDFKVATLKKVEKMYAQRILESASLLVAENNKDFLAQIVTIVAIIIITIVLSILISKNIRSSLSRIANTLSGSTTDVETAAHEVTGASETLSNSASTIAASIEEISSSMEEMSSMLKRNSKHAEDAHALSSKTTGAVDKGLKDMESLGVAMGAIQESGSKISNIIKTIDEIAFQTNILALNAAVEAARAGEAGAGFAVVADEVRALAQRCATAANETTSIIEESVSNSQSGAEITGNVSQLFQDIAGQVHEVEGLVADITHSVVEQNDGISQINSSLNDQDSSAQSAASVAEETASSAAVMMQQMELMTHNVEDLNRLIGQKHPKVAQRTGSTPPPIQKASQGNRIQTSSESLSDFANWN